MQRRRTSLTRIVGPAVATLLALASLGLAASPAQAVDSAAPTQPGTITVSGVTSSSASLKWGASTDNVGIEGYRVYRGVGTATPAALIATTDAVTSYTATPLYSATTYTFGVVAIDSTNNKSPMRTVSFTTAASADATAPAPPSAASLSFRVFSDSRIDVVWGTSASSDVAGYQVLRGGVVVGQVDLPNTPRFSDNGLTASTGYSYSIRAKDSAGNLSVASTAKSATTLASGTVIIARGPYLSNVTGTSGIVSWWTNLATTGTVSLNGTTFSDTAAVQHHAVNVSGLSPGTSYPYTVGGGASASGTLRTAAQPGATFSFATIGDFGGASPGETQNAANIAGAGTQFIQTVGDDIYPSSGLPDPDFSRTYSDFDQRFFKPFATAAKSQAFFPANGNKEYYGDGEFWQAFPMPGANHSWYSYDWGDAHILVLDSEQPFATGSDQYAFAQADLQAHQGATWRIVAIQRPPYSSTTANSSSKPVLQYLVPLFQADNVQLVLSGNSHNYERTYPLTNGVQAAGGVTYVVSGAGGNGFNAFTGTPPAYSAFRESSYYQYAKVTVSPTALTVDAVRADTNAVFDTTTIAAPPKPDTTPPSVPANVTATAAAPTQVNVSWAASTDDVGVTGYHVFRDGAATPVATTTTPGYQDTAVAAGSTHTYTVSAYDAAGNESAQSPAASVTTPTAGPPAPTGLQATANGPAEIDLTWTSVSAATGYRVYRGGSVLTSTTTPSYNDTLLAAGATYSYSVTAVDAAGAESPPSATVSATTAASGTTVTAAAAADATISRASATIGTNYGTATSLTVDADGSMNDFLVSVPVPTGCTPTAATLTVTVGAGSTNASVHGGDFYAAPGTWSESTVNGSNAPAATGSPVTLGAVTVGTAYAVDVTPLLAAGTTGGQLSLRVSTTSNDAAVYVSRNATNGSTAGPVFRFSC